LKNLTLKIDTDFLTSIRRDFREVRFFSITLTNRLDFVRSFSDSRSPFRTILDVVLKKSGQLREERDWVPCQNWKSFRGKVAKDGRAILKGVASWTRRSLSRDAFVLLMSSLSIYEDNIY